MNSSFLFAVFILISFFTSNLAAHICSEETSIVKYLKPIEVIEFESGLELVDCVYVINLDERPEKWNRMKALFDKEGINLNRVSAINGFKLSHKDKKALSGLYKVRLTGGQIGCFLSHISVIKDAYERGYNLIWILEDDVEILEDIKQIPNYLINLSKIDPEWDIFYTDTNMRNSKGYYYSRILDPRPGQQLKPLSYYLKRSKKSSDIMQIRYRYGTHSYLFSRKGMKKVLDYFTHVYLWSPLDWDIHYIPGILEYSTTKDVVSNPRKAKYSDTQISSSLNSVE